MLQKGTKEEEVDETTFDLVLRRYIIKRWKECLHSSRGDSSRRPSKEGSKEAFSGADCSGVIKNLEGFLTRTWRGNSPHYSRRVSDPQLEGLLTPFLSKGFLTLSWKRYFSRSAGNTSHPALEGFLAQNWRSYSPILRRVSDPQFWRIYPSKDTNS